MLRPADATKCCEDIAGIGLGLLNALDCRQLSCYDFIGGEDSMGCQNSKYIIYADLNPLVVIPIPKCICMPAVLDFGRCVAMLTNCAEKEQIDFINIRQRLKLDSKTPDRHYFRTRDVTIGDTVAIEGHTSFDARVAHFLPAPTYSCRKTYITQRGFSITLRS